MGGTLPDSPPHHLSVGTINANGQNKIELDQLLSFMGIQKIGVLCLTDTRLSKKASMAYGKTAREKLVPNATICASGYIPAF